MMKHGIIKYLSMAAWLITALVSLHIGLVYMGWDLIGPERLMNMGWLYYVVGFAGLASLILFVMAVSGACCKCGAECNCAGNCSCR